MRAKLGLKPLEVSGSSRDVNDSKSKSKEDAKLKDDLGEFYHKPANNLAEKAQQEKIRSRLSERKEKRHIETKLSKVKTLGESDSEEDAERWVEKNRKIQLEKDQAAKRVSVIYFTKIDTRLIFTVSLNLASGLFKKKKIIFRNLNFCRKILKFILFY